MGNHAANSSLESIAKASCGTETITAADVSPQQAKIECLAKNSIQGESSLRCY